MRETDGPPTSGIAGFKSKIERVSLRWSYVSSQAPTAIELEALRDARKRVLLVIQTRWVVLGLLLVYGLYAGLLFELEDVAELSTLQRLIPAAAFAVAVAYNGWYHCTHRWFARFRHLNLIQLCLDLVFVTGMIHFSGGALSWFWAMYLVLVLQTAFLGERSSDAWVVGVGASLAFGALLTAEFYKIVPPLAMPFENNALQHVFGYLMLKWAWVSALCLLMAGFGAHMMGDVRRSTRELQQAMIKDGLTRIYNRSHFYLRMNSELYRSKRYGRTFSILVLDVDDFKRFNDTYGHQAGDGLLRGVAGVLRKSIRRNEDAPSYEVDIPCRVGGEEFAVILPEASSVQGSVAAERLRASVEAKGATIVAERIRRHVETLDLEGRRVTVSIGVASYPEHGDDADALFSAADDAMYRAKRQGKNRVVIAPRAARSFDDEIPSGVEADLLEHAEAPTA
jgi:diguanylate cyclase (GGDEF)-like protein